MHVFLPLPYSDCHSNVQRLLDKADLVKMSLQRLFYRGIRSNIKGLSNTLVKCLTSSPDHTRLLQAKEIERNLGDGLLSVTWRDGSSSRYPFIYLRDICRCPQCFHRSSLQRALDPVRELDPSLVASKAELSHDRKQITLTWPNGHVSCFDCDWLFERRLPDSNGQQFEEQSFIREDAQLLGLGADIPTISFDDVLQDERTQLTWLKLIGSHGLVLINGAGSDAGQVKKLGDVLGYLKTMWFGETYPVVNKIGSEDTGASPASIACVPKATCPYKEYRGGLHMIHCRQELGGEGGEHTFVDGFNIAKQLKKEDPENFNRLCTARILYQRKEQSFIREDAQLLGLGADIPTISFDDVLQDERTQLTWLKLIGSHGLVLINGAGSDAGQVKKLGDVLGYLKTMWFGETYPVVNKIGSEDTGASPASIACVPKATCPYKEYRGGLHMIHCRQELGGEGGEHTFVDGFNIAKQLKKEDPENFNRLCTARILYQRKVTNHDADLKMSFSHPVIRLDDKGRLKRIICSEKYRVSFVNVPPNEVPLLYRAYFQFSRLIRNPGYTIKHKLREGDIITMDTDRVLCGRDAYGPEVSGTEVFECGFSDKDMTSSARRLLEKRLSGEGTGFEFDEPVL